MLKVNDVRLTGYVSDNVPMPRDATLIHGRFMKGLGTGHGGALEA
jgi:hypothetical protein